jgi:hypothetical protein
LVRRYFRLLAFRIWSDTQAELQLHWRRVIGQAVIVALSLRLIARFMGLGAAIQELQVTLIYLLAGLVGVLVINALLSPYRIWLDDQSAISKLAADLAEYTAASNSKRESLRSQLDEVS